MAEAQRRFFDDGGEAAEAVPLSHPRAMTAASQVIDFKKSGPNDRRVLAWQKAAWGYYDQVGELKFSFNLISQIVSRVMLYAAISEDSADVPLDVDTFLSTMPPGNKPKNIGDVCEAANKAMRALVTPAEQSELLRMAALNMSIPGECYLYHDQEKDRWQIASVDEFIPGRPPRLQSTRTGASGSTTTSGIQGGQRTLPENTYAARIWRKHPRWSDEADSSMLGVLDQVEKVVLFDQVMRAISRSRLNAGIVYVPNGLTVDGADGTPVDVAIADFTKSPIEREDAAAQVTPLVLTGPSDAGKELKRIELAREIDEQLLTAAEMAMDRTLAGLDIPKDVVSGLSDIKYANSVVIDDSLYKAHIEPLVLLICDAFTTAYLHPMLLKQGFDKELVQRFVIWYNPSQIVTRPDRSQAANEGFDRFLVSGDAWRRARGFSDLDAPSEDEIINRLALSAQIPPEIGAVLIENLNRKFFSHVREVAKSQAGMPSEVAEVLEGIDLNSVVDMPEGRLSDNESAQPGQETPQTTQHKSGGDVNANGTSPPPTRGPGPGRPGPVSR